MGYFLKLWKLLLSIFFQRLLFQDRHDLLISTLLPMANYFLDFHMKTTTSRFLMPLQVFLKLKHWAILEDLWEIAAQVKAVYASCLSTNLGPVFILSFFPSIYFYYLLLLTFLRPCSYNRFLLLLSLNMQIQRVINLYLRHQIQIWDASTVVTSTAFLFQVLQHFAVKIFSDRIFFLSSTFVSVTIFFTT